MNGWQKQVRDIFSEISHFALEELPQIGPGTIAHKKDAADLVSNRDYAMESHIIACIHKVFPDHSIISEEVGIIGSEDAESRWLVDPIDGSCNDAHGIPWSSVSVAYVRGSETLAGLVIQPHTGEVFQAIRGEGATRNGHHLTLADVPSKGLAGAVVMTELLNQHPWPGMYSFLDALAAQDATLRIMGSTALSIVQVATGRVAAAVFHNSGAVDVTAAVLIALEAGAKVYRDSKPLDGLPQGRLTICHSSVTEDIFSLLHTM